jgi:glycerol-3-phosphate cytidylyltransferase-like family protein
MDQPQNNQEIYKKKQNFFFAFFKRKLIIEHLRYVDEVIDLKIISKLI